MWEEEKIGPSQIFFSEQNLHRFVATFESECESDESFILRFHHSLDYKHRSLFFPTPNHLPINQSVQHLRLSHFLHFNSFVHHISINDDEISSFPNREASTQMFFKLTKRSRKGEGFQGLDPRERLLGVPSFRSVRRVEIRVKSGYGREESFKDGG